MVNFTHSITAAVGALVISTACVAAAVGPAAAGSGQATHAAAQQIPVQAQQA